MESIACVAYEKEKDGKFWNVTRNRETNNIRTDAEMKMEGKRQRGNLEMER